MRIDFVALDKIWFPQGGQYVVEVMTTDSSASHHAAPKVATSGAGSLSLCSIELEL